MKYVCLFFSILLFSCDMENLNPASKINPQDDFSALQTSASLTVDTKVTTNAATTITTTSAVLSAKYQSEISDVTEKGICYGIKTGPTTLDKVYVGDKSKSSISTTALNLISGTSYYVRGYYKTKKGAFYGNEISFKTISLIQTVTSLTGRVWMDRNLGASQVATSKTDDKAYGDLYQWGRGTDGHQTRNSITTTTLATSYQPGNSNFILGITNPTRDWLVVKNDNLWQGVNGLNNVCPTGFRLPTLTEWENEMNTWSPKNSDGAFNSPLKLPLGGIRLGETGVIDRVGIISNYYSSTTLPLFAGRINISDNVYTDGALRSDGISIRCIKN